MPTETILPVSFRSNGMRLAGALHLPQRIDSRLPAIVVPGGFGAVKELRTPPICEWLSAAGFVTLRFDHQGFGESEGEKWRLIPEEQAQNLQDAITFLSGLKEVDPDRLGIFGNAWGGSLGIWVMARNQRVRCLVTSNTPTNGERWLRSLRPQWQWIEFMDRLAADRTQRLVSGKSEYVPSDQIMIPDPRTDHEHQKSDTRLKWRFELPLESAEAVIGFLPETVVDRISPRPILFMHCERDSLVAVRESEIGYARAREPKKLLLMAGAAHHDAYYSPVREQMMTAATDWFRQYLKEAS